MALNDIYGQPLSFERLQQFKALAPLASDSLAELVRIEQLDISDFNEAEIRANVIDPIVRILGYQKGTDFSVDLGRQLKILEKSRFPDYKFNLWDADFWLIEAKRPRHGQANFGYEDLAQALEYAAHRRSMPRSSFYAMVSRLKCSTARPISQPRCFILTAKA